MTSDKPQIQFEALTPNIMVSDMQKSLEFYKEVLGFTLYAKNPPEPPYEWAMAGRDETTLMFQTRESLSGELPLFKERPIGGSQTFFIKVEGVEELYEELKGKAEVVLEPKTSFYGMREFAILDPDGYVLMFAEEV